MEAMNIKSRLEPFLRHAGIAETSRRCAALGHPEVTQSRLSDWLRGRLTQAGRATDLRLGSLEAIVLALGLKLVIVNPLDWSRIPRARSGRPPTKPRRRRPGTLRLAPP